MINEIKQKIVDAVKAGREVERNVLKYVLGEAQKVNATAQEQVQAIVRKSIKSIEEAKSYIKDTASAEYLKLTHELEILRGLLPKTLSREEVDKFLDGIQDLIKGAKTDGAAVGVAIKKFKEEKIEVLVEDVRAAIAKIRGKNDA